MKRTKSVDLENTLKNVWYSLAKDFRANLNLDNFAQEAEKCLRQDIRTFRSYVFPDRLQAPPYLAKCQYQLESLFKRCVFEHDSYTDEELEKKAKDEFLAFQRDLSAPRADYDSLTYAVIQKARSLIKDILGTFSEQQLFHYCKFGKRAAHGVPYAKSYLDNKVQWLSGSKGHVDFFKEYLRGDHILQDIVALGRGKTDPLYRSASALQLVNVPKSYKAYRSIEPNTVLGGFHSAGLGDYIEDRLKENGLRIASLQQIHGRLAKAASKYKHLVTADLSKASDSFDCALLNRLLPRRWFVEIKRGRIGYVEIDGSVYYQASFMAMGIGYTFPLETLLFYGLLRSIQELTGIRGRISVYGDDLIYPTKMHKYVKYFFPRIGLKLNEDKTFVSSNFRESCGHDYYHGVEVRPCQPEIVAKGLKGESLLSTLYKLYNGLSRRWDALEIPSTLLYIRRAIAAHAGILHQVPMSFPDTSGIKTHTIQNAWYEPWSPVVWNSEERCWSFRYLRKVSGRRVVGFIYPYYWEALRRGSQPVREPNPFSIEVDMPVLKWHEEKIRTVRSTFSNKRLKKMFATVADKAKSRELVQQSSTSCWAWGDQSPV